jgi:hypothetical protein
MTRTPSPTRRDCWHVAALALASIVVLAAVGCLKVFVGPGFAPRVYVRWVEGISDTARAGNEQQLKLLKGEPLEGTTWAYDLVDPSPQRIRAIVAHPLVADTGNIDRSRLTISDDTRVGTTRIRGGLSRWRDAPLIPWLTRLASASLVLSVLWLATTGRSALGGHDPVMASSTDDR